MRKVGGLTCCWNEEATIGFTIASLLPYVDCYVVVDTGSTDKTLEIIKTLFDRDLESGKLILIEYGFLDDHDISKPKNKAIQILKEEGCYNFIRLDADDVFYKSGAEKAAKTARELPGDVTLYTINHWELYQNSFNTTAEWLNGIFGDIIRLEEQNFFCLRIPPTYEGRFTGSYGHARIYRIDGAVSMGKWTDEAWGMGPGEDIGHPKCARKCIGDPSEDIVHYGWARPMNKKMNKNNIWTHGKDIDPRTTGIEEIYENIPIVNLDRFNYGLKYWPRQIIFPFDAHPEVVISLLSKVREIIK